MEDGGHADLWSRLSVLGANVRQRIERKLMECPFSRTPGWIGVAAEAKLLRLEEKQYGRRRRGRGAAIDSRVGSFSLSARLRR